MKLYWGPHTCAIGIHVLLEEVGLPYETEQLDVAGGGTKEPRFLAINPKAKVPTLIRDDGSVLTEFSAIALWLARAHRQSSLFMDDAELEARAMEAMAYVEGTIHGQGYARIFAPEFFEPQDVLHGSLGLGKDAVEKQGKEIVEMGFVVLDTSLAGRGYAAGDAFTVADAALFYVERWAGSRQIALPINVARHFQRMLARPSVHKVMKLWGET